MSVYQMCEQYRTSEWGNSKHGHDSFFGPGNCVNECIVSNEALLNWAELPLVSIVFGLFLVWFFLGGCFGFFSQENIIRHGPEGKYHAKPIKHLKTMHISAMGQPACLYLVSVSTGEGETKNGILEEIAASSSINSTSLPGDQSESGTKSPKEQ